MLLSLVFALVVQNLDSLPRLRFSSTEYGFIITAPQGFLREGNDPLREMQDIVCFVRLSKPDAPWVRLCVERAGSALPSHAKPLKFSWKGQTLDGGSFTSPWDRMRGERVDVIAAKLPLAKETVALVAMSDAGKSFYAQEALVSALMTFEADERGAQLAREQQKEGLGENIGLIAGIIMAMGVGMWIAKRRKPGEGNG